MKFGRYFTCFKKKLLLQSYTFRVVFHLILRRIKLRAKDDLQKTRSTSKSRWGRENLEDRLKTGLFRLHFALSHRPHKDGICRMPVIGGDVVVIMSRFYEDGQENAVKLT